MSNNLNHLNKKIIHIDMDAFYASVEQRDNKALQGQPLIVGGDPNGRGVVATASYEARKFGVHSAMSCFRAKQLCPQAIFMRPRFDVYRAISQQIRQIMTQYTTIIEPLSLDEAYLDVSNSPFENGSATLIANQIRQKIFEQTQLTCSAGVSYNKMLAKIASDLNKPNGTAVITPNQALGFIAQLPVKKFHGIGKATVKTLHQMQIFTGLDLRNTPVEVLKNQFGKRGEFYHQIAHGIDKREVKPNRLHKSIGSETTFLQDTDDVNVIINALYQEHLTAFNDVKNKQKSARTITIKLKYSDFSQITRSHTLLHGFFDDETACYWIKQLFFNTTHALPIRLVGVTFSNFSELNQDNNQLTLFE